MPKISVKALTRGGLILLVAAMTFATLADRAEARWRGCWGCGAFAVGAIAGAALAQPYRPPVYYAAPPVVIAPPAPVVYPAYPTYPVCPVLPPFPYYCR